MKAAGPILAAVFAGLAFGPPLAAQRYAHLSGVILDPSNSGVPGALVSVVNAQTGFRRLTESQADGGYVVASLDPGLYKITVRKEGFRTLIRFGLKLGAAQSARVDFTLAVGSMRETITVEGAAAPPNSEDGSVGTLAGREEIERLPLNGRGLLTLLELAPGTITTPATSGEAGQFTVNGQRPNTHYFTVDGISANTGVSAGGLPAQSTGGSLPAMTAFGSLHSLLSVEALESVRVQTSTAIPEFGRMPGAQVSLSSRSGTNEFHGSLLHSFRHERLSANDWFANRRGDRRAPLRMNHFGGALGGPVLRDRTFFFLAYEGMRLRQPFAWQTPVPSIEARESAPEWAQTVLGLFPPPNGSELGRGLAEWSGRNRRPARLDVTSLRLDHALTPRLTAFARYNLAPSTNEFGSAQISRLDLRARSFTLGLNLRVRPGAVFDLRANTSQIRADSFWRQEGVPPCYLEPVTSYLLRAPQACDQLVRFSIAGLGQLVLGREGERRQGQIHVVQTAGLNLASHSVRLGVDYRRLAPVRRDASGTLSIIGESLDDFVEPRNLWIASSPPQAASSVLKEVSVFAQDTWRAGRKLTATYGLRGEFSSVPVFGPSYSSDPWRQVTNRPWQALAVERHIEFAPRLGFAFRPAPEGGTVLRAGAGLYYDSSLSIATDLLNGGPFSLSQYGSGRSAPFSMILTYGFTPDLRLPMVLHYSASVEQALGKGDTVSVGYVGSAGRRLVRREIGGPGSTELVWLALATNHGASDYNAFQVQYRRRLAHGFQALVSYGWSHSLDNSSSDAAMHWVAPETVQVAPVGEPSFAARTSVGVGPGLSARDDRGSSDFDVRHALTAALSYEVAPRPGLSRWLRGWAMDGIFRARTGFPINVLNADQFMGVTFANAFRPDRVAAEPLWIADASAPGRRRINPEAFQATAPFVQGGLGRNAFAGFGMSQLDVSVRREFSFGERRSLQVRIEAFNALNQANFADPVRFLASPLFGRSPSLLNLMLGTGSPASGLAPMFQIGGPRSVQVVLRLRF